MTRRVKSGPRCKKSFRDTSGPPLRRLNPRKAYEELAQLHNAASKQATIITKLDVEIWTIKCSHPVGSNITPRAPLFAALGGRSSSPNPCAFPRIKQTSLSSCTRAAYTLYFNLGLHFEIQSLLRTAWAHVYLCIFPSDAPGFDIDTFLDVCHPWMSTGVTSRRDGDQVPAALRRHTMNVLHG